MLSSFLAIFSTSLLAATSIRAEQIADIKAHLTQADQKVPLIIVGEAGTGKKHCLCEAVKDQKIRVEDITLDPQNLIASFDAALVKLDPSQASNERTDTVRATPEALASAAGAVPVPEVVTDPELTVLKVTNADELFDLPKSNQHDFQLQNILRDRQKALESLFTLLQQGVYQRPDSTQCIDLSKLRLEAVSMIFKINRIYAKFVTKVMILLASVIIQSNVQYKQYY